MKRNHHVEEAPDFGTLADDAKALLAATAEVAEDKVIAARERLAASLDQGREIWASVQQRAVKSAKATDKAIRQNPYQSIGIAVGVGALLGILFMRRK